jgi:hypothetical protein
MAAQRVLGIFAKQRFGDFGSDPCHLAIVRTHLTLRSADRISAGQNFIDKGSNGCVHLGIITRNRIRVRCCYVLKDADNITLGQDIAIVQRQKQ